MLRWLYEIVVGPWCDHQWEIYREGSYTDEEGDRCGYWYDLRCTKCGDLKRRSVGG